MDNDELFVLPRFSSSENDKNSGGAPDIQNIANKRCIGVFVAILAVFSRSVAGFLVEFDELCIGMGT